MPATYQSRDEKLMVKKNISFSLAESPEKQMSSHRRNLVDPDSTIMELEEEKSFRMDQSQSQSQFYGDEEHKKDSSDSSSIEGLQIKKSTDQVARQAYNRARLVADQPSLLEHSEYRMFENIDNFSRVSVSNSRAPNRVHMRMRS
jgi:hypothetical protein